MGLKRSVTDAEKSEKKCKIMAAARVAFEHLSFHDISMSFLADRTGLAKGTIYLYFETKESVFLAVLAHELKNWFMALHQNLETDVVAVEKSSQNDAEKLVSAFKVATRKNLKMVELFAFLKPVLDEKISSPEMSQFKSQVQKHMSDLSKILTAKGYFAHEKLANRYVVQSFTALIGTYQLSSISKYESDLIKYDAQRDEFFMMLGTLLQAIFLGSQRNFATHQSMAREASK